MNEEKKEIISYIVIFAVIVCAIALYQGLERGTLDNFCIKETGTHLLETENIFTQMSEGHFECANEQIFSYNDTLTEATDKWGNTNTVLKYR